MTKVFDDFTNILIKKFEEVPRYSEDDIRYCFFYALTQNKFNVLNIFLETDHPVLKDAKIDTSIEPKHTAVEFKYHRSNKGGSNQNRTRKANELLYDLLKLKQCKNYSERYLVYLTDFEMNNYFERRKDFLRDLISKHEEFKINNSMIADLPETLKKGLDDFKDVKITPLPEKKILDRTLRVYKVD